MLRRPLRGAAPHETRTARAGRHGYARFVGRSFVPTSRESAMASLELHELLKRLHDELGRATTLDDESRRLVGVVVDDLRRVGAQRTPPDASVDASAGGLEALAVRFEADHPGMASALRQVADVLGKAGI
jgi:hypothetical protein